MSDLELIAPPLWTTLAFVTLILGVQAALLYAAYRAAGRRGAIGLGVAFGAVMGASAALAETSALAGGAPPRVALYVAGVNALALVLALGPGGRALATAVPPAFWVLFHSFRLPLEVILHLWHRAGSIPVQMTWEGQNVDVISGAVALGLGVVLLRRPGARWAGWLAHGVGLALLANVMRIAVLSFPSPWRAFEGPPLLLPFHAPYTWIVPFAVAAALFGHVVGLRALSRVRG